MTKLTFATEMCSRCHGSGHYSYNQMTGTTCFKCEGRTVALTKQAKKASDWLKAQNRTIQARDVTVGMRIVCCGAIYNVQSIEVMPQMFNYIDTKGDVQRALLIKGVKANIQMHEGQEVEVLPTSAEKIENTKRAREMFPGAIIEV